MARKSLIAKQKRLEKKFILVDSSKIRYRTKFYNRCKLCGRVHSYMREFGVCRCCFRKYARLGQIMGVKKASR